MMYETNECQETMIAGHPPTIDKQNAPLLPHDEHARLYEKIQLATTYHISHRNTVPLFNFHAIFAYVFGLRVRLNWSECSYFRKLTTEIYSAYKQFISWHQRCVYEIPDSMLQLTDFIQILCHKCRQFIVSILYKHRGVTSGPIKPEEPENTVQGMQWLQELTQVYVKLGGQTPCSCAQFLKYFRQHHARLSDHELQQVTTIIETTLGNSSLRLIIKNLEHYLMMNWRDLPSTVQELFRLQFKVSTQQQHEKK